MMAANQDKGLFDNLPLAKNGRWIHSFELQDYIVYAAGNFVNEPFHLAKRNAYNRLSGNCWALGGWNNHNNNDNNNNKNGKAAAAAVLENTIVYANQQPEQP